MLQRAGPTTPFFSPVHGGVLFSLGTRPADPVPDRYRAGEGFPMGVRGSGPRPLRETRGVHEGAIGCSVSRTTSFIGSP